MDQDKRRAALEDLHAGHVKWAAEYDEQDEPRADAHRIAAAAIRTVLDGTPTADRRNVAAYLLDRADQYVTESGSWVPLVDAAKAIMNGEVETAVAHGELDDPDLLARVDAMVHGEV